MHVYTVVCRMTCFAAEFQSVQSLSFQNRNKVYLKCVMVLLTMCLFPFIIFKCTEA